MVGQLISLDKGPSALARARRSNLNANAKAGVLASFASLAYRGKVWRLKYRQTQTVLRDERQQPLTALDVVIVGVSAAISRTFYLKGFVDGSAEPPDCSSTDGIKPDGGSQKQSATCALCRHQEWGSRITDNGKKAKACQESKRLAVVPLTDLENKIFGGPMLLSIPPMSMKNLSSYADFLDRKGAGFECVATRISFDVETAYPKLTFEALGFLDDVQQAIITGQDGESGVCADPLIDRMLVRDEIDASDVPVDPPQGPQPEPVLPPMPPAPPATPPDPDEELPPPRTATVAPFAPAAPRRNGRAATVVTPMAESDMEAQLDTLLGDSPAA